MARRRDPARRAEPSIAARRYRLVDPLDLPRVDVGQLLGQDVHGIMLEDDPTPRFYARPAPEFHDDPDGARLFGGFADGVVIYPPAFVATGRDVRLTGYRMAMAADGLCHTDESLPPEARAAYADRLASTEPFPNEDTGLRRAGDGLWQLEDGRAEDRLTGSAVVLCSNEPSNFGSFLFRVLPKLHAVRRYGLERLPVVAYGGVGRLLEFLALAGVEPSRIVRQDPRRVLRIGHAIQPCLRNPQAFQDDETRAFYAQLRAVHGGGDGAGAKVYVSRHGYVARGGSTRVMTNEAVLIARLRALGFTIVEPETLTPAAQVAVFAQADLVVGPGGSGMFGTMFCRPGTRVIDIESERDWIHGHCCMLASGALRYGIFEGLVDPDDTRSVHRRFSVNIEALLERIDDFRADRAARTRSVPPPRLGTLDRVTPVSAHGWARDPAADMPAEVEILVGGTPAGRVAASLPRADLAEHGDCAFVFHFPPALAPAVAGTAVEARFADTGAPLARSPRTIG